MRICSSSQQEVRGVAQQEGDSNFNKITLRRADELTTWHDCPLSFWKLLPEVFSAFETLSSLQFCSQLWYRLWRQHSLKFLLNDVPVYFWYDQTLYSDMIVLLTLVQQGSLHLALFWHALNLFTVTLILVGSSS